MDRDGAVGGGGDDLAQRFGTAIAGRKDAAEVGAGRLVGLDIPGAVALHLATEEFGVRQAADRGENAVAGHFLQRAGPGIGQPDAPHPAFRLLQQRVRAAVPENFNAGIRKGFEINRGRAQRIPPVNQIYLGAELRKMQRITDRRVAAANHRDRLAAVEHPVTGRAVAHTAAAQRGFALKAERPRHRAGRDHDTARLDRAGVGRELLDRAGQFGFEQLA